MRLKVMTLRRAAICWPHDIDKISMVPDRVRSIGGKCAYIPNKNAPGNSSVIQ